MFTHEKNNDLGCYEGRGNSYLENDVGYIAIHWCYLGFSVKQSCFILREGFVRFLLIVQRK